MLTPGAREQNQIRLRVDTRADEGEGSPSSRQSSLELHPFKTRPYSILSLPFSQITQPAHPSNPIHSRTGNNAIGEHASLFRCSESKA